MHSGIEGPQVGKLSFLQASLSFPPSRSLLCNFVESVKDFIASRYSPSHSMWQIIERYLTENNRKKKTRYEVCYEVY